MTKMAWNDFVIAHPRGICALSGLPTIKFPKGTLARDGRKFPTPYNMLLETLNRVLVGHWTARKAGSVVQIIVADSADLDNLQKLFQMGSINRNPLPSPCGQGYQFSYDGEEYGRLGKALGYASSR
jgi:hypothetical protein